MSKEFGDRLRARRQECGMTTTACAAALGITQPAWNQWELGLREPKLDMLVRVSKLVNVSADWLLGLRDSATPCDAKAPSTKHPSTSEAQAPKHQPPGSLPACSKCPYLKKLRKLEAVMGR